MTQQPLISHVAKGQQIS